MSFDAGLVQYLYYNAMKKARSKRNMGKELKNALEGG